MLPTFSDVLGDSEGFPGVEGHRPVYGLRGPHDHLLGRLYPGRLWGAFHHRLVVDPRALQRWPTLADGSATVASRRRSSRLQLRPRSPEAPPSLQRFIQALATRCTPFCSLAHPPPQGKLALDAPRFSNANS